MGSRGSALAWLSKKAIRIATDATWVFVIVIALSLGSSAFSIRYLSGLESDIGDLYENDIKGQTYAQNAYITLVDIQSAVKDLIIAGSEKERSNSADALKKGCASLESLVLKVTQTFNPARYRTLIAKSKRDLTALVDAIRGRLGDDPPTETQGRELLADLQPLAASLRADIVTINDVKRSANQNGLRAVRIQLRISLAITIVILLITVAVRFFLYRAARRSLRMP